MEYNRGWKIILVIYFIFFVLVCVGMLFVGMSPSYPNAGYMSRDYQHSERVMPQKITTLDSRTKSYDLKFQATNTQTTSIRFYTNHQEVKLYVGERLIYRTVASDTMFGRTTGTVWNIVALPVNTTSCRVVIHNLYDSVGIAENSFSVGNDLAMYHAILIDSIVETIISLAILAIGLYQIFNWFFINRKEKVGSDRLYFGEFVTLLGFWSLNETDFMTILVQARVATYFMSFMLMMLLVVPFILFVKHYLQPKDRYIWQIICALGILNILVSTFLQFTGINEFKNTAFATHFLILISLCYMLFCTTGKAGNQIMERRVRAIRIAFGGLAIGVVIALIAYYTNALYVGKVGRDCMIIFIAPILQEMTISSRERIVESKRMELYRKMATFDLLTGMANRNAFDRWLTTRKTFEQVMFVTFDLNDLKECNDTYGHEAGDRYITQAADMIKRVFGPIGSCFRIGGDEFCVIIPSADRITIGEYTFRLQEIETDYNKGKNNVPIYIAFGYAVFDAMLDRNLTETRNRADEKMYSMKKEMKKGAPYR